LKIERPSNSIGKSRALIIDQRSAMGIEVCRKLAAQGSWVEVFSEEGSPAFRSRYCHRRLIAPPSGRERSRFLNLLQHTVEDGHYDEIYICSEPVLELIAPLLESHPAWRALLAPPPQTLKVTFSKHDTIAFATNAGVPVPRTIVPGDAQEARAFARELGFPLVIKGEKGESARNVRIVRSEPELEPAFHEIVANEAAYDGRPAVQEFVNGASYLVGGLFHQGRPLRVSAHRKVLTYPPSGGVTVKGVTERHADLLDSTFKVFAALNYTGFGSADFIRDNRTGEFKFLEINPRVWATIGLAHYAGVDLFTPYRSLVKGMPVAADLNFREGVEYHWLLGEFRFAAKRPLRIFGLFRDLLDPRSKFDFQWSDPGPFLRGPSDVWRWFARPPSDG
jgi:predicted ATP-grasp superfamily ATP-dependent carboligase